MVAVKKFKFTSGDTPDIDIIGINTSLSDYRLAYFLNKEAFLKLERLNDLPVFNEKVKETRYHSFYSWYDCDRRINYYLISNDHSMGKMIEQYSQANYFLLIKGKNNLHDCKALQSLIRKITSVTFVFEAVNSKIKELEGILQDLELHEMEQGAANKSLSL